jgi:hypothetical protein
MSANVEGERHATEILSAAERVLSARFGEDVRLRAFKRFETTKSVLLRCHALAPRRLPADSFIAKHPREVSVNPAWQLTGLLNEWAALALLDSLAEAAPLAPRFYGGDTATRVLVMEDLGEHDGTTTDALAFGDDPALAEEAFAEHAALIGRLHALTSGAREQYTSIREALGVPPEWAELFQDPWPSARLRKSPGDEIARAFETYRKTFDSVGLKPRAGADAEVALVTEVVEDDPGPFLALCQGDQNGPGGSLRARGRLRLYDFDSAALRHALLEGVPAVTSWGCVMRLPARLAPRLEAVYRAELSKVCAAAREERLFRRALAEACARWHVFQVSTRLKDCLERDTPRGPTTRRQQFLAWMDTFARLGEESGHMTALAASARDLAARLRSLWPADAHALPPYPAFRREVASSQ